jgi:hypothetical protein
MPKKGSKVAPGAISIFWEQTPYKKVDEVQKLFLEDLILLITKGFFPLST